MKSTVIYGGMAAFAFIIVLAAAENAVSAAQGTALVRLQTATPGAAQTGHSNISGTAIAGQFKGGGAALTGLTAANLTGTVVDARLSANVDLLNGDQTISGVKTFTARPLFNGGGGVNPPFTVDSTTKVPSLNADLLDGLSSTDFMSSALPLDLIGSSTTDFIVDVQNTSATGAFGGVRGRSSASTGAGVLGNATSTTGENYGVVGLTSSSTGWAGWFAGGNGLHASQIGVRTTNPTSELDVDGRTSTDDFTMRTGAATQTVLLGNANGEALWGKVGSAHLANDDGSLAKVTGGSFRLYLFNGSDGVKYGIGGDTVIALWKNGTTEMLEMDPENAQESGHVKVFGYNGSLNAYMGNNQADGNRGYISVADSLGAEHAKVYVDSSARGTVTADIKNFIVSDPDDPRNDIAYACIEGPEAAMYMRGTAQLVNGEAHITLPDHFRKLASESGITVTLTPRSRKSGGLGYEDASPAGFTVFELNGGQGTYEFDWRIEAVRKGYEDYKVTRPWDEALASGDKKRMWEARLKSIAMKKSMGNRP